MKAVPLKYDANPSTEDLRDSADNKCGLVDPDFTTHGFPIWAICGPYVRGNLEKGDIVLFLPHKKRLREAGLDSDGYICTGVLVVSEIIKGQSDVMKDERLSKSYKEKYLQSLEDHIGGDGERTKNIRPLNVIIGDPSKSRWLGREGPSMSEIYANLGLGNLNLSKRKIPYIRDKVFVKKLYRRVVNTT